MKKKEITDFIDQLGKDGKPFILVAVDTDPITGISYAAGSTPADVAQLFDLLFTNNPSLEQLVKGF